jgi:hypothetical protein
MKWDDIGLRHFQEAVNAAKATYKLDALQNILNKADSDHK